MQRNAEVVRQWKILQELQGRVGRTIDELAEIGRVSTRTARRDLQALEDAGFSLYNPDSADGKVRWALLEHPLKGLKETSFTVAELAALYFSRTLLECAVDRPFQADLATAFAKLEQAFSPRTKAFFDRLPQVLTAKGAPVRSGAKTGDHGDVVRRLMAATVERHRATLTYHSFSSRRVKDYLVEPYRLAYGNGGFYLSAFVPEYGQIRTFAVERIRKLLVSEETFTAVQPSGAGELFADSLGVHSGKPERVVIEFHARVAPYIEERTWHPSQRIEAQPDGSILLSLDVCLDWTLSSWILGFGPFARVVTPKKLAKQILEGIEEARVVYAPRLAVT